MGVARVMAYALPAMFDMCILTCPRAGERALLTYASILRMLPGRRPLMSCGDFRRGRRSCKHLFGTATGEMAAQPEMAAALQSAYLSISE
jgi:hypothetical protein